MKREYKLCLNIAAAGFAGIGIFTGFALFFLPSIAISLFLAYDNWRN